MPELNQSAHQPLPAEHCVILAFGTSGQCCSVSLASRDAQDRLVQASLAREAGQDHSRVCLAMAGELLAQRAMHLEQVDAIAFDAGPGSFTGLRIGCGVAQGLGFALDRPVVPVPSLEAFAWQAQSSHVLVATDARMQEAYMGAYRIEHGNTQVLLDPAVAPAKEVVRSFEALLDSVGSDSSFVVIGDAFERFAELQQFASRFELVRRAHNLALAEAVAQIALRKFSLGEAVAAADAAPLYVRNKVALDVHEQQRLRESRDKMV